MNKKTILWIIISLIVLNGVLAIGIKPAKTIILSEETSSYEGKLWIVNNDYLYLDAKIYLQGPLEKYISLKKKKATLTPDDDLAEIPFTIKFKKKDLPPGDVLTYIIVEQDLNPTGKDTVSSKVILKHKLIVKGPYPDKYVEPKLNFHETPTAIEFVSEIQNLGKKSLDKVKTKFYLNDKEQNALELSTEEVPLKEKETILLRTTLDKKQVDYGEFEVRAITSYDGLKVELNKKLIVGKPEVDITYFNKYLIANKINQYSLELLNKWNQKIENVFVDVEVKKDGQKIDDFRTKSVELDSLMSKVIKDYFDAKEKNPGEYTFEMVVNFLQNYHMAKKEFNVELMTEEEFEDAGITGAMVVGGAGTLNSTVAWSIVVFLLMLISAYVGYRYAHRHDYEGGDKGIL